MRRRRRRSLLGFDFMFRTPPIPLVPHQLQRSPPRGGCRPPERRSTRIQRWRQRRQDIGRARGAADANEGYPHGDPPARLQPGNFGLRPRSRCAFPSRGSARAEWFLGKRGGEGQALLACPGDHHPGDGPGTRWPTRNPPHRSGRVQPRSIGQGRVTNGQGPNGPNHGLAGTDRKAELSRVRPSKLQRRWILV